jgi:hypothetical protein
MGMGKLWSTVVATVIQAVIGVTTDGDFSNLEMLVVLIALANAILVGIVPNLSVGVAKYAKLACTVVAAALILAANLWADGTLSTQDWLQIGLAVLTAAGVVGFPAPQYSPRAVRGGPVPSDA